MKKIMFNDKYGLTQAVLEKRKTMTRRIVPQSVLDHYLYEAEDPTIIDAAKYEIGDVVAVAQPYGSEDVCKYQRQMLGVKENSEEEGHMIGLFMLSKGWSNKMFVAAGLMPHQIRIENIRVERLQDISDEDCMAEGVFHWGDPFREGRVEDFGFVGATQHYLTRKEAYAALIDKISGKGTWERNPWVFVYEFELIQ